jgi:hypothetical protein
VLQRLAAISGKRPESDSLRLSLFGRGRSFGISIYIGEFFRRGGRNLLLNGVESGSSIIGIRSEHYIAAVGRDVVFWIEALDVVIHPYTVEDVKAIGRI